MMQENVSLAQSLASLPEPERNRILANLSDEDLAKLLYDWKFWARPEQLAPEGDWIVWLLLAGRGFGKTRTGAEWARMMKDHVPLMNWVGPDAGAVRDVMVEGPAGIKAISPPWDMPEYEPSKRRITWPNGSVVNLYSAEDPEELRGPQCYAFWADEVAAWKYPQETWDNLQFGFRLGDTPKGCVTTTPKPIPVVKELIKDPTTAITRGSTYDNIANLSPVFIKQVVKRYEGTRLGRQELHAEVLDDFPGAIVARAMIDAGRVTEEPERARCVVGVDPAVTTTEGSDETGIVVDARGADGLGYLLADLSCRLGPNDWARRAIKAYHEYEADLIVAEANQGGDMVKTIIHSIDANVPVKLVRATKGKHVRFEPVGALYEQGRIRHVGSFPQLEDQICAFTPSGYEGAGSPDRADAHVWAMTELMFTGAGDLYFA